jgi:hypothetical protein
VVAVGIMGRIENKHGTYETWVNNSQTSFAKKLLVPFNHWSIKISVILGILLFAYIFTPTKLDMFIVLCVALLIKQIVGYFIKKNKHTPEEA